MSVINLFCLLVVSILVLFGFIRGFRQKTIRTAAFFTGLVSVIFLANPISNLIMRSIIGSDWLTGLYLKNIDSSDVMTVILNDDLTSNSNVLSLGLEELNIPSIFHGFFISNVFISNSSVRVALASSFANSTILLFFIILLFSITFFLIRLFLKKATDTVFGEKGNNFAGRIFGALRGFAYATIILVGLMFIIVLINQIMITNSFLSLNNYLDAQLKLSDGKSYSLGKIYFNMAAALLNWISLI